MPEVPHISKDHCKSMFIGSLNNFIIAHGATGLNDRRDAGLCRRIDAVAKREERVGCHYRAVYIQSFVGRLDAAILVLYTRLIWPAPMPIVIMSLQKMMAFDLTYLTTVQANSMSSICADVGVSR